MIKSTLFCFFIPVLFLGKYSFSQTDLQQKLLFECSQLYNQGKKSDEIVRYLKSEKGELKLYQLDPIIDSLSHRAKNNNDDDECFDFMMARIDNGCKDAFVLEDFIGTYFRLRYPEKYSQMEVALNKQFIEQSLKYYPDINLELAFTIRHLFRYDQRTKQVSFTTHDKETHDSLVRLSDEQDSISEKVLKNIFDNYGYPGMSLIGPTTMDVVIIMHHLSTDFQVKYIHLFQEAVLNGELQTDLSFLIDKILHKCCNKTIYGTSWSKYSPLVTDPDEVKRLKELLKIL